MAKHLSYKFLISDDESVGSIVLICVEIHLTEFLAESLLKRIAVIVVFHIQEGCMSPGTWFEGYAHIYLVCSLFSKLTSLIMTQLSCRPGQPA